jgi:hypothetical protein
LQPARKDRPMADAAQIKEHMEVLASDGQHVGTVDHLEGVDRIKLTRQDPSAGGKHHYIPVSWIDRVDAHVHLDRSSQDVTAQWEQER